ncbi:protein-glutamate O-methyltransferase CheR [Burkholderia sp. S171]|uniref:CheR family methyltransferase n=1 Tax=Burkholderia sp. S171 TaxID=1641860 RepID=UPI0020B1072E|nr:CheR family methyltransferase [Burkholderia sp. S171]
MKHVSISDQARRAAEAFHKIHEMHESRREPLPHAQVAQFAGLLQRTIGLDPSSIGEKAIERAVSDRFAAWLAAGADGLDESRASIDAFWLVVNGVPEQLQALIEAVVVPETWFFRDAEAFNALAMLARVRLLDQPFKPVRILSMPCSTGEEAYTAAMAMLDAGIAPERFSIDALDISGRALDFARHAHYGSNAFRSRALGFRERFFAQAGDQWRLLPEVTERVRFRQANLLTLDSQTFEPFDFVFCRNVLIYLGRQTQHTAMRVLDGLLAPDGTLFVGPAETGLMMREGMASAKLALAFAFRRPEGGLSDKLSGGAPPTLTGERSWDEQGLGVRPRALFAAIASAERAMEIAARAAAPKAPVAGSSLANTFGQRTASAMNLNDALNRSFSFGSPAAGTPRAALDTAANAQAAAIPGTLEQAQALADAGALPDAAEMTRTYLKAHPASADAYYLLGVIADARGEQSEARGFYKRALYLDPGHGEALTHLAAVLGLEGDRAGSQLLLARAERAERAERASRGRHE